MKRLLLAAAFLSAGISVLLWASGGARGPGLGDTDPDVEAEAQQIDDGPGLVRPMNLPLSVDVVEGYSQSARPESLTFVDPQTGEQVVVRVFERWHFTARSGKPVEARRSGRQAIELEDLELLMFREPKTLAEAHAIERGDRIVKWRVTAPAARVDDLALQSLDAQPGGPETVVQLSGGVRIFDLEKNLEIQGESIEVQPYLDRARGAGNFVVQHEAFELTGSGLDLERKENQSTVVIHENAVVDLYGDIPGSDGEPLLDLGSGEFRPGSLSADGAVLVHRVARVGAREDLDLEMKGAVHAEQEGGRSLDADIIRLSAFLEPQERLPGDPEEKKDRWQVESFDAEGDVIVIYPGKAEDGSSYVLRASAHRMVYELTPGTSATVLLESNVEITLRGDVPLEGLGAMEGPSVMRATAREQALFSPAPKTEVRPGEDPTRYRLLTLRGDARLTFRGAGLDPTQDTLEGEQMRLLLKERTEAEVVAVRERLVETQGQTSSRVGQIVAVSFAVLGEVRLGGTRMSGMTHRLVGRDLDMGTPVFEASGPGTSFAFHGIRRGERMLGGDGDPAGTSRSPAAVGPTEEEPVWVFQRLTARGGVVVDTTLGGPSVGMPTRLEGNELTYDRVSDRARIVGNPSAPARLAVGDDVKKRQHLSALSMHLDRGRGEVEARGRVRGVLLASSSSKSESDPRSGLLLPERRLGTPATFGVATNGRIEIRTQVGSAPWDPQLDTEQIIRIEGEFVAEMTSDSLKTDRLRAGFLEVALMRTLDVPADAPTAPSARMGAAGPGTGTRKKPQDAPDGRLVPWTVETERLQARFGTRGLETLDASGGVRFSSEEGEIGGRTLRYDAAERQASIRGGAHATFGPSDGRSEVRADDLVMTIGDDGPERLEALGRTLAMLYRRDEKDPRILERIFVWCRGVTMTATEFRTDALDQVLQQKREGPEGAWESPFSLWANRVVVTGSDLLSRRTAEVRSLVASGPRTTLRTGEGDEQTTVWGDRFELDVTTSRATLESGPSGDLKIQLGTMDDERMRLDQTSLVLDIETGEIVDWKNSNVILRGARK